MEPVSERRKQKEAQRELSNIWCSLFYRFITDSFRVRQQKLGALISLIGHGSEEVMFLGPCEALRALRGCPSPASMRMWPLISDLGSPESEVGLAEPTGSGGTLLLPHLWGLQRQGCLSYPSSEKPPITREPFSRPALGPGMVQAPSCCWWFSPWSPSMGV